MEDQKLKEYIDALVEEKVNEKTLAFQNQLENIQQQLSTVQVRENEKITMLVTSFELDKVIPAFIIANGAASFGMDVTLFFTLWGINALKEKSIYKGKNIKEKMITMMLPSNPKSTTISRLNMMGVGTSMMKMMMKENNIETLPDLIDLSIDMGAKLIACQMTMGMMGITTDEIRKDVDFGGVALYIEEASESNITLTF
ncbi:MULTISPECIES: DsrE/DsrF/DrsH-like family protein [unclassified Flammeovirga]|uniref:DsrE/DsrF/DrsH-like family protein n=1 Tax=unclassified Flammeovirga TaxID=2637820 RepID=UPI0006948245|nr:MULTISPECIES: DsrE/DsrF/DrsH-like family protein [unclassified Flammeovirga]MBD0403832.1 DsrE/DsrF/DrsH-like family protein [Flammeovirga sp. EKP202]